MAGSGTRRGGGSRGAGGAVARPIGWLQNSQARRERIDGAGDRSAYAKRLQAMPKEARRAIAAARVVRRDPRVASIGEVSRMLSAIDEGRMLLAGNYRRRKGALSPGQVQAVARSMTGAARKLRVAADRWQET